MLDGYIWLAKNKGFLALVWVALCVKLKEISCLTQINIAILTFKIFVHFHVFQLVSIRKGSFLPVTNCNLNESMMSLTTGPYPEYPLLLA